MGLRSAPVSFCARLSRCLLPPPDLSEDLVPPRGLMVKEMTPTFGPRYAIGPGNTLARLSYLQSHFQGCGERERKKKKVAHKLAEALKQMVADSLGRNTAATDMINEFTELRGEN